MTTTCIKRYRLLSVANRWRGWNLRVRVRLFANFFVVATKVLSCGIEKEPWTEDDCRSFEIGLSSLFGNRLIELLIGMQLYGKNFPAIQKNRVGILWRNIATLITCLFVPFFLSFFFFFCCSFQIALSVK